jgi:hypothetical protein
MATTKVCSKCNEEKEFGEFYKYGTGTRPDCKSCNKNSVKLWAQKNKSIIQANKREYYNKNRALVLEKRAAHYKERDVEAHAAWRRQYEKNKKANDVEYRIVRLLRNRLGAAMRGKQKTASTIELLGCDVEHFKLFLEAEFEEGMTWENYGRPTDGGPGWQVDHIRPCASFNLEDAEEQKRCFHWTNLQPLWAADNLAKGDSLVWVKT